MVKIAAPSLTSLLDSIGLGFGQDQEYTNLENALTEVSTWLETRDPARDLHLLQTLWINPQLSQTERPCSRSFLRRVQQHKKAGMSGEEGLLRLQALLGTAIQKQACKERNALLVMWRLLVPHEGMVTLPDKLAKLHQPIANLEGQLEAPEPEEEPADEHDDSVRDQISRQGKSLELLWWGEAMYSHRRRKRFARLQPVEAVFYLAYELANRVPLDTPAGAVESYLIERLQHLDRGGQLKLEEQKSLGEWLEALHSVVTAPSILELSAILKQVVREDAWLLPISRFINGVHSKAQLPLESSALQEQTGYAADPPFSLEQLALQVLRESLLDRHTR